MIAKHEIMLMIAFPVLMVWACDSQVEPSGESIGAGEQEIRSGFETTAKYGQVVGIATNTTPTT